MLLATGYVISRWAQSRLHCHKGECAYMHSFTSIRYFWQSTVMKGVKNDVHFFVVNDGARGLGGLGVIKDAGINVGIKFI